MFLRISSAIFAVFLASCGGPSESVPSSEGNRIDVTSVIRSGPRDRRIPCAIDAAPYADICTLERAVASGVAVLTIRHPDGGFRRLRMSSDGRSVEAADGALPAEVISRSEASIEVAVGDARYRLPAVP